MSFPESRPRRLRSSATIRKMVRETHLSKDQLIYPLFVVEGTNVRTEIASLAGQFRLSVDEAVREAQAVAKLGVPAVLLFGIPKHKDAVGSGAWHPQGVIQRAIREIKRSVPELVVLADACFCEYTDHGHCGVLTGGTPSARTVDNDATLENLGRLAISYAEAGVDIIAPSGMLDGMIGFVRDVLDEQHHDGVTLMSYAAKYASAYYGPFREAVASQPSFGDRATYQMDPANVREAIREVALDVEEGADIVMVKPALAYLDVIAEVRNEFDVPVAAYNVSGEYAMLRAAADRGFIDYERAMMETLLSMRRAGADLIVTYHAKEAAQLL